MLDKLWKDGRLPRVILFYGRGGVAVYPVLLDLLRTIFCQQDDGFCGSCNVCLAVENDRHDDLLQFLDEQQRLKVSDANKMQEFLRMRSPRARVLVIDNAHQLTLRAANKLLKTLEEPPGDRSFIFLLSNCYRQLLPTITSRCFHLAVTGKLQEECDDYQQEFDNILNAVDNNERTIAIKQLAKCPWRQVIYLFEKNLNEKYRRLLTNDQHPNRPVDIQLRRRRIQEVRKIAVQQQIQLNMHLALENLLSYGAN